MQLGAAHPHHETHHEDVLDGALRLAKQGRLPRLNIRLTALTRSRIVLCQGKQTRRRHKPGLNIARGMARAQPSRHTCSLATAASYPIGSMFDFLCVRAVLLSRSTKNFRNSAIEHLLSGRIDHARHHDREEGTRGQLVAQRFATRNNADNRRNC